MIIHSARACLIWLLLLHSCCYGVLVTKNMGKPSKIKNPQHLGASAAQDFMEQNNVADPSMMPSVVCIPGVGGSQLQAKVNFSDHWYCDTKKDKWFMIWLALSELVPGPPLACWMEHMALRYNSTSNRFYNASDIDVIATDFGTTNGFEYLDDTNFFTRDETLYFATLVSALVKVGYVRNTNLFGAPYDWRLSPDYLPGFFISLRQLIEEAYSVNEVPVAVIAHSMGNLFFKAFLSGMPQEWTSKYIGNYIAISAPWVGASEAVLSLTSGYNFAIPYLGPMEARALQRTMPSTYFLLPVPKFWQDMVFVTTPSANYTSNNYQALFESMGISAMYPVYEYTQGLFDPYAFPGVNTYCYYGYNVSTNFGVVYKKNDWNKEPDEDVISDGDGTVPIMSLNFCEKQWANNHGNFNFTATGYLNQEHVDILSHTPMIIDILNVLIGAQK